MINNLIVMNGRKENVFSVLMDITLIKNRIVRWLILFVKILIINKENVKYVI